MTDDVQKDTRTGKITEIVPITWRLMTICVESVCRTEPSRRLFLWTRLFVPGDSGIGNPGRVIRRLREAAQSLIRGPYAATAERPSLAAILSVHGYSPPEHLKYMVAGPIKRSTRRRIKHFGT
jgi:hypothetical protein